MNIDNESSWIYIKRIRMKKWVDIITITSSIHIENVLYYKINCKDNVSKITYKLSFVSQQTQIFDWTWKRRRKTSGCGRVGKNNHWVNLRAKPIGIRAGQLGWIVLSWNQPPVNCMTLIARITETTLMCAIPLNQSVLENE